MFASLNSLAPTKTGKANSTPVGSLFPFDEASPGIALAKILAVTPHLAPRVTVALFLMAMCDTSVTPQRLCACGCGAFVTGKARCASPACRKRLEREMRRMATTPGRQFNLVMQDEMTIPIRQGGKL